MDERKYPLMSDLNFDTMELTFTTTTNAVLARAAQEANGLNDTPVDPAHILLAMTSLTSDFSVYKPLRELGFDYDDTRCCRWANTPAWERSPTSAACRRCTTRPCGRLRTRRRCGTVRV